MSSHAANGKRRRQPAHEEHADERWLLTYSDMITLLMALFMVLWAISSVNVGKFDELKVSLHSAFSGKILPQGTGVLKSGTAPFDQPGTPVTPPVVNPAAAPATPASVTPTFGQPDIKVESLSSQIQNAAAQQDEDNLQRIKRQVDRYARQHGLASRLRTTIDERGLVIHVLSDAVLFDSGQATLNKPASVLAELAHLVSSTGIVNPVRVEGNTDSVPVSSGRFRSNWELSSARANAVLQFMLSHGVRAKRLSTVGYGDQNPMASNQTAAGRSSNRRVDLVILRRTFR
jgi:chemotaxis protein MotB